MRRIAFIMPWLLPMPPVRGGAAETLVDSLLRRNETEKKLDITVYCIDDDKARERYSQYSLTRFKPVRVSKTEEKIARILRGGLNRVFHLGIPFANAYLCKILKAMRGERYERVILENLAAFTPFIKKLGAGEVYLHMHNVVHPDDMPRPERIVNACAKIITVSDYISEWMYKNLGAREGQCAALLNCVDAARFSAGRETRDSFRERLGFKPNDIVFMYAGRICPEKGGIELARAFKDVRINGARLVFVGSKWFGDTVEDDYLRLVRQTLEPVADRVRFTGYVDYADMPGYYAAADVAVMPSVWEEPGALSVLEAQSAGVPVITTLSGGMAQNVCPEGALLIKRGEGLEKRLSAAMSGLALEAGKREKMSRAALDWSAGRDEKHYYEGFLRVLD